MAIMAMATVRKISNCHSASVVAVLSWLAFSSSAFAGEWQFVPSVGIEETYTDNVELTFIKPKTSFVTQTIIGLETEYTSRSTNFSLSGSSSNVFFSHDSQLNDNFIELQTEGQYLLWTNGPTVFATANILNNSRNAASNSLADFVSGGTVQSENFGTGLLYNVTNNDYSISSSITYNINRFEDGIGESDSTSLILNAKNGNNSRINFWQLSSSLSTKNQYFSGLTRSGEQYSVNALLGLITPIKFNPFIRFYDENISGDIIKQSQETTSSWGPGVRWLISPHLMLDLSYNFVSDDTVSDDYIATNIQWEPSARTSLSAGYSQRFFGDSYDLEIQHKTKRLTNSITYKESLEIFDRNNFEQIDQGIFWCPTDTDSIGQCFIPSEQSGIESLELLRFFTLEPIDSNEFSLNKRFKWTSTLQLSRTFFTFNTSASRHERIESKVIDDTLAASLSIKRKISGKSDLTLLAKYDYRIFDKNNPEGNRQEDHYRTVSATYTKDLAPSLSTHFTLQHVNRDSNVEQYSYDEVRAIINVTKEF